MTLIGNRGWFAASMRERLRETERRRAGHELYDGFYRALAEGGDATPDELAARTGTSERYVREWLEQQAVAGFLTVDDPDTHPSERRYELPAGSRAVSAEQEDLNYLAPLATLAIGVLGPTDALLEAFRTGGGVPYEAYGADTREGIGASSSVSTTAGACSTAWPSA